MTLSFIFQSEVEAITVEAWKMQCPFPIYNGIASNLDIVGTTLNYTVTYGSSNSTSEGTFFICDTDPITGNLRANTIIYEYSATLFDAIPYGQFGYVLDWFTMLGSKANAGVQLVYLFLTAPAQISALSFFTYIYIVLIGMMGLGVFMVIRGS